jgi:hypothetical protein
MKKILEFYFQLLFKILASGRCCCCGCSSGSSESRRDQSKLTFPGPVQEQKVRNYKNKAFIIRIRLNFLYLMSKLCQVWHFRYISDSNYS